MEENAKPKGIDLAINSVSLNIASTTARGAKEVETILNILPERVKRACARIRQEEIVEVVLDLGRLPEIRTTTGWQDVIGTSVDEKDLSLVSSHLSPFGGDNRAGIAGTLHRVSAIRNRSGEVIGLTCRVGRAVQGTIDILQDIVESGASILLLGKPGVGKTTMLREIARILANQKRVVIVDTSNEIAGDGNVPHHGVGRARRMPVPNPNAQHDVMIEAVENHMPEVIIIDEIGTAAESLAARTIAERGVQLIGTAHGMTIENLMANPTLSDLVGGIVPVTLSDDEAKRRGTRKTVLERKAPPTFDVLIEIRDRDHYAIHTELATTVDAILNNHEPKPEIRQRTESGVITVEAGDFDGYDSDEDDNDEPQIQKAIFLYGITRDKALRAIDQLGVNATIARRMEDADVVIALKAVRRKNSTKIEALASENVPIIVIRSNSVSQVAGVLKSIFGIEEDADDEDTAITEAEHAAHRVVGDGNPVELTPRNSHIRSLQHLMAEQHGLESRSTGIEPNRRVRIFRQNSSNE